MTTRRSGPGLRIEWTIPDGAKSRVASGQTLSLIADLNQAAALMR
jgi:hypothetical protein